MQVCLLTADTMADMQEGRGGFASDVRYRWVYELRRGAPAGGPAPGPAPASDCQAAQSCA